MRQERHNSQWTAGWGVGLQVGQPAPGCGEPAPGGLASGVSGRLSRGLRRRAAAGAHSKEGAAPHLQAEVRELGALAVEILSVAPDTAHSRHLLPTLKAVLLTLLVSSATLACSTPAPTPDIPATVAAEVKVVLEALATATPIPTPTQSPTPTLALTHLFNVPAERVISVGEMQGMRGPKGEFWRDKEPILLRGCATGVYDNFVGRRWAVFSQDGGFSKDRFFVQVGGYRKVSKGSCYDMVVSKFRDRSRCYSTSFLPPSPFGCETGWFQKTDLFLLPETGPGPAIRPISRSEVGGQQ